MKIVFKLDRRHLCACGGRGRGSQASFGAGATARCSHAQTLDVVRGPIHIVRSRCPFGLALRLRIRHLPSNRCDVATVHHTLPWGHPCALPLPPPPPPCCAHLSIPHSSSPRPPAHGASVLLHPPPGWKGGGGSWGCRRSEEEVCGRIRAWSQRQVCVCCLLHSPCNTHLSLYVCVCCLLERQVCVCCLLHSCWVCVCWCASVGCYILAV